MTFEYGLLSYFRETDIRYRVQLAGLEKTPSDWIPDPAQRYSHLTAGSYRFRVWGRDASGVVSGPVEVPFVIPLSPWRTAWAYLLYVAVAGLLIGGGVRWRTAALQRRAGSPPPLEPGAMVELRFAVRDTGIGISADQIDRLFRPRSARRTPPPAGCMATAS